MAGRRVAIILRVVTLLAVAAPACGTEEVPAADFGRRLFTNPKVSSSPLNLFSCATCHQVVADSPPLAVGERHSGRIDPGYNLYDSVHRGAWWGGYETQLLDAINRCIEEFMGGRALTPTDDAARQLYEYLAENSPSTAAPPLPLTVVKSVTDLATVEGDVARGRDVYDRACLRCHGQPHSGAGRLSVRTTVLPEATISVFGDEARAVVVEKIRHGRFFGIGGQMPLYSAEAISDSEVADILAYLGL